MVPCFQDGFLCLGLRDLGGPFSVNWKTTSLSPDQISNEVSIESLDNR